MAGRKSKLTPERQKRLCQALAAGNFVETACAYGRIHKTNFYRWLTRGERETSGPFRQFRNAIKKSQAAAEVNALANIVAAAERGEWQAAAWLLERRWPEHWRR